MNLLVSTMKSFIYLINIMCMVFGIITICLNGAALRYTDPGTDEHAFLIVSIIMGAMLCMTTFFGCYGIVCEILGVTLIYAIFMFMLLVIQYLQVSNFRPEHFQRHAMQKLEDAWSVIDLHPITMQTIESQYSCCALYSPRDYNYKQLATPRSCYADEDYVDMNLHNRGCLMAIQDFYQHAAALQKVFNRVMIISELIVACYAIILCVVFYRQRRTRRQQREHIEGYVEPPQHNHITSRTSLLQH